MIPLLKAGEKYTYETSWDGEPTSNKNIEYKINGVLYDIEAEEGHETDQYGVPWSSKRVVDGSYAVITIYADKYTIVVD